MHVCGVCVCVVCACVCTCVCMCVCMCLYMCTSQVLLNCLQTDINMKDEEGCTPLMAAVKISNNFMVKQLLEKLPQKLPRIRACDNHGRTALHLAAMVDNFDAM